MAGQVETTIQWLGGLALVAASIFLIPAVTSLIAGLYLDDITEKVEHANFPNDPPGRALPRANRSGSPSSSSLPSCL